MCRVMQYRSGKTDEIKIVGALSAFDWLDIADGGHKEATHRADDFFPPSVLPEKGTKRWQAQIKKKAEAGNHVTSNLLIFCLEKEVGGVKWTGGSCWNEIYCKWEKTPTRDRSSQMETLLNQDKLQMGLDFLSYSHRK